MNFWENEMNWFRSPNYIYSFSDFQKSLGNKKKGYYLILNYIRLIALKYEVYLIKLVALDISFFSNTLFKIIPDQIYTLTNTSKKIKNLLHS